MKSAQLKYNYGISIEEYYKLLVKQQGLCAICGLPPDSRALSVDHCHVTGKIRGLLCFSCNAALGLLKDDLEVVYRAYKYLEDTSEGR